MLRLQVSAAVPAERRVSWWRRSLARLGRFGRDRSGNFAITTALAIVPLILSIGFAIDGSRYYAARANLQNATDMTALALAASPEQDVAKLRAEGAKFINANVASNTVENVDIKNFTADANQINLSMSGSIHTTFMKIANVETMSVITSTQAMRSPVQTVELALVLDNTYSMSADTGGGVSRLAALKTASHDLISSLMDDSGNVMIGVVPYAQYVNVGLSNANASWLQKEPEGPRQVLSKAAVTTPSGQCENQKTGTTKSCSTGYQTTKSTYYGCDTVDGIQTNCGTRTSTTKTCSVPETSTDVYKNVCPSPAEYKTVNYQWYGCVASRYTGTSRLTDADASVKYPGLAMSDPNGADPNCLTPIVPLTIDKSTVDAAIDGLVYMKGNHKPNTYIPGGLIWGQNILSPTEPFTEGAAYDADNRSPKKIMILMTDGDNTMIFNKSNGYHTASTAITPTNNDTQSICNYSKQKKIEIYTVAFMVTNTVAKALLENCATDKSHYFDASNKADLLGAFQGIANAINNVRLAK